MTLALGAMFFLLFAAGNLLLPDQPTLPSILATLYGLILVPALALTLRMPDPAARVLRFQAPRPRALAATVLLSFPVSLLALVLFAAQTRLFPVPADLEQIFEQLVQAIRRNPVLGLFTVAVSPGICEEVLFRGLFLYVFERFLTPLRSALAVGLLFGLFHLEPHRFLVTAALGVLLAVLTQRSGSIVPAMLLHTLYNAWVCMPALIGEERTADVLQRPWIFPAALLSLALGARLFARGGAR